GVQVAFGRLDEAERLLRVVGRGVDLRGQGGIPRPLGAVTSPAAHQGGPASSSFPHGATRLSYHSLAGFGKVDRLATQPDGVPVMEKPHDSRRIREAAAFLGVSSNTLRNGGGEEKIAELRHPVNNYRLYRRSDLEELLRQVGQPGRA